MDTSTAERSPPPVVLLVDINVRMCQEDADNGVVAMVTGGDQGGASIIVFIAPIDIKVGIVPEDVLHTLHIASHGCQVECLLHPSIGSERKKKEVLHGTE